MGQLRNLHCFESYLETGTPVDQGLLRRSERPSLLLRRGLNEESSDNVDAVFESCEQTEVEVEVEDAKSGIEVENVDRDREKNRNY